MLREAHPREREVGIEYYVTDTPGIGGTLKTEVSDFRVVELEDVDVRSIDADPNAYPHLVIRAELTGWDTFGFAQRLADAVGIHREQVRWAGTKDKEAITTQLFSVAGVDPAELPEIRNATLEPIGRFGRGLTFGDLVGNTFELRVRDASHPARHADITEELRAFGDGRVAVPNFFGPQRFGSIRPVTHEVGRAILDRDWEAAVMRYLGNPTAAEPADTQAARRAVEESRDWTAALDQFPHRLDHERRILHRLADSEPYRDALDAVPRSLRRMFVHATQSYLFNRIVSERLSRELPCTRAVEGDIVCFGAETSALGTVPDPGQPQRVTASRVETVNRHIASGRAFVTAPLIGTETTLGTGEPGDIERSILRETGIDPADFDLPEPYDSSGTRRSVLVGTDVRVTEDPLTFEFSLPSGSYATVLMREYLKTDPAALA